jgi:hypothetical protein
MLNGNKTPQLIRLDDVWVRPDKVLAVQTQGESISIWMTNDLTLSEVKLPLEDVIRIINQALEEGS